MKPPIFRGKVEKGRIDLDNRGAFRTYLQSFEGKRVELVLRERSPYRSDEQNRYYHGVVVAMISDHTGYTPEETHDQLKAKFKVESTSRMKSADFQEYISRIVHWAASDLGVCIPDPNQIDF